MMVMVNELPRFKDGGSSQWLLDDFCECSIVNGGQRTMVHKWLFVTTVLGYGAWKQTGGRLGGLSGAPSHGLLAVHFPRPGAPWSLRRKTHGSSNQHTPLVTHEPSSTSSWPTTNGRTPNRTWPVVWGSRKMEKDMRENKLLVDNMKKDGQFSEVEISIWKRDHADNVWWVMIDTCWWLLLVFNQGEFIKLVDRVRGNNRLSKKGRWRDKPRREAVATRSLA